MFQMLLFLVLCLSYPYIGVSAKLAEDCSDLDNLEPQSWHIHYIYNDTTSADADAFTESFILAFIALFPPFIEEGVNCPFGPNYGGPEYPHICFLGGGKGPEGGPPGPWDDPQHGFFVPLQYIEETKFWSLLHRNGLSLLFHANTGCMADDHSNRAVWAGEKVNIHPEMFPCNTPGTGCYDMEPTCGCALPMPGGVQDTCDNCIANGGDGY